MGARTLVKTHGAMSRGKFSNAYCSLQNADNGNIGGKAKICRQASRMLTGARQSYEMGEAMTILDISKEEF